jgi:dihydrolipoamide dehydrogenase
MSEPSQTNVLVIGGGPGGYVAAIRAGQLGLDTLLVTNDEPGGTCLIRGCIPSKALIHAATEFHGMVGLAERSRLGISLANPPTLDWAATSAWKDAIVGKLTKGVSELLKRAKVRVIKGWATFEDAKNCTVATEQGLSRIHATHVILANGSVPAPLPHLSFGGSVISSTEALSLRALPRDIAIVGAGYIGLELGTAFAKLGVAVSIIEAQDRILPLYDPALTAPVRNWLTAAGVRLHLGASARELRPTAEGQVLIADTAQGEVSVRAETVLVTVGRRPNVKGWGLEKMAIDLDGPFVKIDAECRTSMRNVWAIGDLAGEPMLAHKASAQGSMVSEMIAGHHRRFDPAAIPSVCFTEPEIVSVGLLPDYARQRGLDTISGVFPFAASGRALSMEAADNGGFVRVLARKDDHRILGIQAVGTHVAELSGEFVHAIEMGALIEDITGTIHAHPTLGEAFGEASLRAMGVAVHI